MQCADLRGSWLYLCRDDLGEDGREASETEILDEAKRPLGKLGIKARPSASGAPTRSDATTLVKRHPNLTPRRHEN